jgi:hypothetical protein
LRGFPANVGTGRGLRKVRGLTRSVELFREALLLLLLSLPKRRISRRQPIVINRQEQADHAEDQRQHSKGDDGEVPVPCRPVPAFKVRLQFLEL